MFYDAEVLNSYYSILLFIYFLRFIAKKECTSCSKTSYKIVLINWNKYLYNVKSEIKLNINSISENNETKNMAAVQFVTT